MDRNAFIITILVYLTFFYLMGGYPHTWFYKFYAVLAPINLLLRFIEYRVLKQQFILIDYCYINNLLISYYLIYEPKNEYLFRALFLSANGVLAVSSFMFGNFMVLHKIDRYVSVSNHLLPSFVFYNLSRVTMPYEATLPEKDRNFCSFSQGDTFFSEEGFKYNFTFPYAIYFLWLIFYYVMIFWVLHCLFEYHGYDNLYREIGRDNGLTGFQKR